MGQSTIRDHKIHSAIVNNNLVRGGYANYFEFLNNAPSVRDSFYVEWEQRTNPQWVGTKKVIPRLVRNDRKVKKIWGFSDGNQVFIFHQVEFFPVVIDSDQPYFYGYDLMDDQGATNAAMWGGAIGSTIYASNAKKRRIRYEIDLFTGSVMHPEIATKMRLDAMNELIVYRRSKKESLDLALFSINDSLVYRFEPDSYVHLAFPPEQIVTVCTENEHSTMECMNVSFDPREEITYIKLTLPEGGKFSKVESVSESTGLFDYSKVEKKQDKRGPQKPIEN